MRNLSGGLWCCGNDRLLFEAVKFKPGITTVVAQMDARINKLLSVIVTLHAGGRLKQYHVII